MEKFKIQVDDRFLKLTICENTQLNIIALKRLFRIVGDTKKNTIVILEPLIDVSPEALHFINKFEKLRAPMNITIVSNTFTETLITNFYNKFYKPHIPLKIYRNVEEAK